MLSISKSLLLLGFVCFSKCQEGPGEPLYLTPLIKSGEFGRAQGLALVPEYDPVITYTGFITVNETAGSNLFFFYFPAEASYNDTDNEDIPILLWSNGGPGTVCMSTVFGEAGPFLPIDDVNYTLNPLSWHKRYHMIYLDNPVTVGFSHTSDFGVHSAASAAVDIYEFLQQFFQMFPDLQRNPFYNAGVSYGGRYTTEIAHYIHQRNIEDGPNLYINLTGLIEDSPWYEGKTEAEYADVLYGAGVIGKDFRDDLLEREEEIRRLIEAEEYMEAFNVWFNYVLIDVPTITGYAAMYNLINDSAPFSFNITKYAESNVTRRRIHAGDISFGLGRGPVELGMAEDLVQSSASKLDKLLKNGYRFLQIIGNVDVITGHIGIRKVFDESITWEGRDELFNGNRTIWRVGDRVAGYISGDENRRNIIMRNAGHGCHIYQPEWTLEALIDFLG